MPFVCCGVRHSDYDSLPDCGPGLMRRAVNFAKASIKHGASGFSKVDDYTRAWRLSRCLSCVEYYDAEKETCLHPSCGCGIKKHRGIIDKLSWASQQCPIGRWKNPPMAKVLSVYRKTGSDVSIGLGVNAQLSAAALCESGITCQAIAVASMEELAQRLSTEDPAEAVVLEGLWCNVDKLAGLAAENYRTTFIVRCHSQIAFLQIEPEGIGKMREIAASPHENLRLAGNSRRFTDWATQAWKRPCLYLPNLYKLPERSKWKPRSDVVRLASFGAMRIQKHHSVAAAAAVLVAKRLGRPVEFYVNEDNRTPGGPSPLRAVENIVAGQELVTLQKVKWQAADDFRKLIATIDVCFQLSASETFNIVTADAAAAGVPSVVGPAIDWVPRDWVASIDDPAEAAEAAWRLLNDDTAGERGRAALEAYCVAAMEQWREVLPPSPPRG